MRLDACLGFLLLSAAAVGAEEVVVYPDGRPVATMRMDAEDQGVVLRHGDGPNQCDTLGAREALIFEENGVYHLFYDGTGPDGWLACLATSKDLKTWEKKGRILDFGKPGESDSATVASPWVIHDGTEWHMFYVASPNASPPPDLVPSPPYLTMKAHSATLAGPWIKQPEVVPFRTKPGTYYKDTASPGHIVKQGDEYLMFFSASFKRTLGIARTKDLNGPWTIDPEPIVSPEEQIENSSLYFEPANRTWFLFTNHIGLERNEYTDAIWVYWSQDLDKWDAKNKAVVLDGKNCTWSKKCIGMPSVIPVGNRLAIFYDAPGGDSISHMRRDIGLAWLELPLSPPKAETQDRAEAVHMRTRRYTHRTAEAATAWQEALRQEFFRVLRIQDLVDAKASIPFEAESLTKTDKGSYTLEELSIRTTAGRRMKVALAVPKEGTGPFPAVVAIHGHGGSRMSAFDQTAGENDRIYKEFGARLAEHGYVVIAPEVGQHEVYESARTLMGERLWDCMRCVDYLESLPSVDKARIGCGGLSLGGEMTMWLGAMDPRVKATVSAGFLTFMNHMEKNHCMCWKFDGLRERVDWPDVYAMIAPRALQCQNGLKEPENDFTVSLARLAVEEIRPAYEDLGEPENVGLHVHDGAHEVDLEALVAFFDARLKG